MIAAAGTAFADWFLREFLLHPPGHDEPAPGVWMCGECPYMNAGSICTKCGAPAGAAAWWQA